MRRIYWRLFSIALPLFGLLSSACVATLPEGVLVSTVAPELSPAPMEQTSDTVIEDGTPAATEALTDTVTIRIVPPTPTPEPTVSAELEPATVRDKTLAFLRAGYKLKVPADEKFEVIDPPEEAIAGEVFVTAFGSGPWQVLIGEVQTNGNKPYRTVIVANDKNKVRWWGLAEDDGLVSTSISSRLPRLRSKNINGWVGRVVQLPEGSIYDDYFVGAQGNYHGITSNKAKVKDVLGRLDAYKGRVKIWGELRYGVNDYNARHLLVRKIQVMDGSLPAAVEPAAPQTEVDPSQAVIPGIGEATTDGSQNSLSGPTGMLSSPLPGSILLGDVLVSGEAAGVYDDTVVIRVETEDGTVLTEGSAAVAIPENGRSGLFSTQINVGDAPAGSSGRVALYTKNPDDGSMTLLIWAPIRFAGPVAAMEADILGPPEGTRVRGSVIVRGTARGVHNRRVLVRLEDIPGNVWGKSQAQTDNAGNWEVRLKLSSPATARTGRVAVYDLNPDTGERTLLAARKVTLAKR